MRLIDADAPVRAMDDYVTSHNALRDVERVDGVLIAKSFIDEQPTVDAVQVVRCGECKCLENENFPNGCGWCDKLGRGTFDDWFCADGERKEQRDE